MSGIPQAVPDRPRHLLDTRRGGSALAPVVIAVLHPVLNAVAVGVRVHGIGFPPDFPGIHLMVEILIAEHCAVVVGVPGSICVGDAVSAIATAVEALMR